jgi:hypothetical protein
LANNSLELGRLIRECLSGHAHGDTNTNDDVRGIGAKITKCNVTVIASQAIRDAEEDYAVEMLARRAEEADALTVDKQINILTQGFIAENARRVAAGEPIVPVPSREAIEKMVDRIRLNKAGKRTVFEGGSLLHYHNIPGGP